MQFIPHKHLTELVRVGKYIAEHPNCPVISTRRKFNYLVYEAHDRSFVECGAAVKMAGKWFIWPPGLGNYVEHQINKTLRQHAA